MEYPLNIDELKLDVYYSNEWLQVQAPIMEGIPYSFNYRRGLDWFEVKAVKRPILEVGGRPVEEADLFDLETPYGYGGFLTNSTDPDFIENAIKEHKKKCQKEGIIAEFIRFHPFNPFPLNYSNHLDFCAHERDTINITLSSSIEDIFSNFRSSLKRNIRKALKGNLKFRESNKDEHDREIFVEMYYQTMKKKEAHSFYFFSKHYFQELFSLDAVRLFLIEYDNKIVNGVLILDTGKYLYYHLGGTSPKYYHLNTNPFNFYKCIEAFSHGKRKGLFLGGGNSSLKDDPLYRFKQKFSPETIPFYIGGIIHDTDLYYYLNKKWEKRNKGKVMNRFLKYRF